MTSAGEPWLNCAARRAACQCPAGGFQSCELILWQDSRQHVVGMQHRHIGVGKERQCAIERHLGWLRQVDRDND